MVDEKNEGYSLDLEGIEDWMKQFITDPFFDGSEDGIRLDLFETEHSYIVEATTPGYKKEDLLIEVEKNGLRIQCRNKKINTSRFVTLPVTICRKIIKATYSKDILEITIQKAGEVKNHERNINIK
ncbi:Hsp20/alpha crystallin family protein [Bacillus salitolerans]|uniref:Hsp20/alpha crystallin family protein n=1 Tax=Bacillus salitolerans TaxID=1437434 RepID=A0ABW4LMI5_9BACI